MPYCDCNLESKTIIYRNRNIVKAKQCFIKIQRKIPFKQKSDSNVLKVCISRKGKTEWVFLFKQPCNCLYHFFPLLKAKKKTYWSHSILMFPTLLQSLWIPTFWCPPIPLFTKYIMPEVTGESFTTSLRFIKENTRCQAARNWFL